MKLEIEIDDAQIKAAAKSVSFLEDDANRKTVIEAANEGLVDSLRRHFAAREKEPHSIGWWNLGQGTFPKRYFWRGTRGTSVSEKIRTTLISPARLETTVSIESPELVHKLDRNPPPITPKGNRKFLAIPASPVAAQWTGMPRFFPGGLRFAYSKLLGRWLPALVAASNYKKSGSKAKRNRLAPDGTDGKPGENEVVYWLVHKVKTRRDPRALPSPQDQHSAVRSAVAAAVSALIK